MKKNYPLIITDLDSLKPLPELKYLAYKILIGLIDDSILKTYRYYFKLMDFDNDGMISI